MIDVGDMRKFARAFGKWFYGVNPNFGTDELRAVFQRFAMTAPIGSEDGETLSVEEFCKEAIKGYTSGEEASEV